MHLHLRNNSKHIKLLFFLQQCVLNSGKEAEVNRFPPYSELNLLFAFKVVEFLFYCLIYR
jgi:hypothetical protein